jgi:hypothetical protein
VQQPDSPVEVLSGTVEGGLRWVVVALGDQADLFTMLRVYRGEQLISGSGFGGPGLYPGSVINEWRGQADDLPFFVMARVSPSVDRVIAATAEGTEIMLAMSPPVERFGLRFAAAALPPGERPGSIRAEREGTTVETRQQPMPPSWSPNRPR